MNLKEKIINWLAPRIATRIIKWYGNRYYFEKAIKLAEKAAKKKRTYIYFIGGKYRVVNRKQIQYWRNHSKGVRQGLKVSDMTNIQLYDTQGHINSHPLYTSITLTGIDIKYCSTKYLK
jgi:hypothetical protein